MQEVDVLLDIAMLLLGVILTAGTFVFVSAEFSLVALDQAVVESRAAEIAIARSYVVFEFANLFICKGIHLVYVGLKVGHISLVNGFLRNILKVTVDACHRPFPLFPG